MKVKQVIIKEFKKLKDIDQTLDGKNVFIRAENGVGKSTFMQFINIALGSKESVPPEATGEGLVLVDKNGVDYELKVKFKDGKSIITVCGEGLKDNSKSAITQLVGKIDFDIDEFVKMSDTKKGQKDQVEAYRDMLDEETKQILRKIENTIKANFDDRTELTSDLKRQKAWISESPLFGKDLNIEPLDAAEIQLELENANKRNIQVDKVLENLEIRKKDVAQWEEEIKHIQAKIFASKQSDELAAAWIPKNPKIDISAITTKFNTISEHNKKAEQAAEQKRKIAKAERLEEEIGDLTVLVETGRQELQDAIRDMNPIVEGLYFDDEKLLYKGVPVSTASLATSEIIELGFKLKMAQNPDLGVICLEHGESLGNERLKHILEIAKKNNWQVIIEEVKRGEENLTFEFIPDNLV
jgi:hypothetical protein